MFCGGILLHTDLYMLVSTTVSAVDDHEMLRIEVDFVIIMLRCEQLCRDIYVDCTFSKCFYLTN